MSKNPQVVVLTADIEVARNLSLVFKKLDIVLDIFDRVEDFLVAKVENDYDLAILDISLCLYQGTPLVKRRELATTALSFFFNKHTHNMLSPTYGMNHLGYLNGDLALEGQVKNLLVRFNKEESLLREAQYYRNFHDEYKNRQKKLTASNQSLKEKLQHRDSLYELMKELQEDSQSAYFSDFIGKTLDKFDFVKGYSLLELNSEKNRLMPVDLRGKLNVEVPSLWLGEVKNYGVDEHARVMAQNVVSNLVLNPVISLSLSTESNHVQALLVLELSDEVIYGIDWEIIENFMSGLYAKSWIKKSTRISQVKTKTAYDLLSRVNLDKGGLNLVSLDLSDVVDFIDIRPEVQFNWSKFWNDIRIYLAPVIGKGEVYSLSVDTIVFTVESNLFEETYQATRDLCKRFKLSNYFKGAERIELQNLEIRIKELPYSQKALIKKEEDEIILGGDAIL